MAKKESQGIVILLIIPYQESSSSHHLMRGADIIQEDLFSYRTLEARIPQKHPPLNQRKEVDFLLTTLNNEFDAIYVRRVQDSISPERLQRASLFQVLLSSHSKRLLVEYIDFNLQYSRFVDMTMDNETWDHYTFCAKCDCLLNEGILILAE